MPVNIPNSWYNCTFGPFPQVSMRDSLGDSYVWIVHAGSCTLLYPHNHVESSRRKDVRRCLNVGPLI